MARARLLKPDFFEDERLNALPLGPRLVFQALWCLADREGRQEDRPQRIASFAFPPTGNEKQQTRYRRETTAWLNQIIATGMVIRYEVGGESYLLIPRWSDHQKIHVNEPKSALPAPLGTNDHQRNTKDSNVAGSRSRKKAEAEAETGAPPMEFKPLTDPPFPDEPGFVGRYVREHEQRTGKQPSGSVVADAAQLERDFGTAACLQVGEDTNWEKPPNWMRPKLLDRQQKQETSNGRSNTNASRPTTDSGFTTRDAERQGYAPPPRDFRP